MTKDARRHSRIPYLGPIVISWEERGEPRYARSRCIDVSESGLRLEVPVSIPLRTEISLNAERIKVSGQARVRHVVRCGAKFLIGVEMSHALRSAALSSLRDPVEVVV